MPSLRLIADDLTGALDTAAGFTGLVGAVEVAWVGAPMGPCGGNLALDTGTRERSAEEAARIAGALAPRLQGAEIAFKKVDSLLRGPWAAELAACFGTGAWRHAIVAPAFPYQGRRTVEGRQFARTESGWQAASGDIAESLHAAGLATRRAGVGDGLLDGVAVYDATDDADLDRIASFAESAAGPVLWCGSGGLAGALAGRSPASCDTRLVGPVLGLFGSDRPETAAQLAHCPEHRLILPAEGDHAGRVAARLRERGAALVSLGLPEGTGRQEAAARIAASFGLLARALPPPGTLLVAGGETLKALCLALGTETLVVTGQVAPGIPRSRMRGGLWDGVAIVSKSGAFGSPAVWRDLLRRNGLLPERTCA
ncbi:four-carbon acid sugar kinase family protein [Methylobacterium nodulans]|uniref:Type III effector Hrp-dependent outers n=1 Tax=Methylobacterium nodulans (strain LMG 21967 / CNCM I-2342 / ORS 2060) TaxID=460265 RepID=B8IX68_METNO|nr:four-carbon acid sugar kinase family protein [Methylobacterium nodulans]ACL63109.1 type III effector Hrp-dependent outers [Methylobacterium nodulans ORS 2060]